MRILINSVKEWNWKLIKVYYFICFCFIISCINRKITVNLKITDKYIPQIDFKYTIDNEQLDGKPYLVLRNSDTLFKYLIEEFQIDDKCTLKTSIGILIGIQDSNKILIVADENFDNNYANDSVYCVKIKNPFLTKKQFAELFPIISIASKNLSQTKVFLPTFSFKVYPVFFGVTNYGNKINLLNVNRGSINFILLKYLFAEKRTFKNKYLFTVTSHNPFLFDNENDTCFLGMNNYTFRMERQNQKFTDSDIFMAIKHNNNIAYLNDDSILKLGKHKYYPEQINLINRTIVLQRIKKTAKTIEYPVVIHGLSINSNKTDSFILNKGRKFTLLYFTGSWCIPCKVTLPKILEFDSKYKNLLQIISIHKEKNILEAQKYIAENKIAWLSYYEQLDCMDSDCLDKLYKIQSYPTFLVFDQKGQVILRSNGNNGLSKIEEYFEKIK